MPAGKKSSYYSRGSCIVMQTELLVQRFCLVANHSEIKMSTVQSIICQSADHLDSRPFITSPAALPPAYDTTVSVHQASHQSGGFYPAA